MPLFARKIGVIDYYDRKTAIKPAPLFATEYWLQGVIPAQGSVKPTVGFTFDEVSAASREAAFQFRNDLCVTRVARAELDPPQIRARVTDSHRQIFHLGAAPQTLEPFHRCHTFGKQIFAQPQVVERRLFEPVEIYMIEREAPVMLLDHRKRRAQNVLFAQAQSSRETLDKAGLARAEISNQSEQLSTFEQRREPAPPRFRLMRRAAFDHHRDHSCAGICRTISHRD